jgi:hypothetical protein
MKPFNLQDALSGKPVQTRDGRKAECITYFEKAQADCKIVLIVNGTMLTYYEDGSYMGNNEHNLDLFMAEQEQEPRCVVIKGLHVYDCDNEQHANEVAKEMNGIVFKQVL